MLDITTHQNHPAIESSLLYLGQLDRFRTQDSDFGNSLYKQVTAGKRLTDSQHEHACLLLWRYVATDKLRVPAQGVLKKWLAERKKLYPYTPPVTVLETAFMGQVSVSDQGMLVIRLPNNYQKWVPAIKSLQVQNRQIATYNHDTRLWYVPLDWLDELMGVLPETHFTYTQDVLQVHAAMKQKQLEAQATIERKRQQHQQRLDTLLATVDLDAPLQNGWLLHRHQKEAVRFAFEHQNVLIGDEQGVGKAQPLTSLVLTPTGYRQMGDLQVGDTVFSSTGLPTKITGVYPQGKKSIYRVTFSDGFSTECCDEHLWNVRTNNDRRVSLNHWHTKSLAEIMDTGIILENGNKRFSIPITAPVQFPERDLYLHPYVMGVLLGDGCLRYGVQFTKPDPLLADIVRSFLPSEVQLKCLNPITGDYSITRILNTGENAVLSFLRSLDLVGCNSLNKFIPDLYKYASTEQRLFLLQGLLDTDGSITIREKQTSGHIEYSSSSEKLANDVVFLVQSLGGVARLKSRVTNYTYKGEKKQGATSYRVNISLPCFINPFLCPTKASKYIPRSKYQPTRLIKSVEYIGEKEAQCISVDAPNHLYLTDYCIVTHNTLEALVTAKTYQQAFGYSVVCIVPVTAKDNWLREAKAVGVSINVFSNSFAGIPKPSAVTTDFVLIVDESHVFKNLQAQRTKNLMTLGKSPHVQAIICMTGTPIDNGSPANIFSTLKLLGHRLGASKAAFEKRYCGCTNPELVERPRQQPHYLSNLRELRRILTVEEPVMIRRKLADVVDLPPFTRQMVDGVLTPEAEATYHKTFLALQEEYNRRCADNEISADGWHLVLLNHLRHAGSLAKVGSVVDLALQFLYGQDGVEGEQVVVFTVFKDTAQQIAEQIRAKGFTVDLLTGETKQSDRDPVVQKFQQHKTDVLVCTIQAGGVAITLTAASKVILADRDWRLNEQAESRINRISQTKPTTAYWVRHTLVDAYIDNILIDKAETSDLVLDGYSTGLSGIDWSKEARHLLDLVFA